MQKYKEVTDNHYRQTLYGKIYAWLYQFETYRRLQKWFLWENWRFITTTENTAFALFKWSSYKQ